MKRKVYETPVTTRTAVELEQGFMTASKAGDNVETGTVTSGNQEIEGDYDFRDNEWE